LNLRKITSPFAHIALGDLQQTQEGTLHPPWEKFFLQKNSRNFDKIQKIDEKNWIFLRIF